MTGVATVIGDLPGMVVAYAAAPIIIGLVVGAIIGWLTR